MKTSTLTAAFLLACFALGAQEFAISNHRMIAPIDRAEAEVVSFDYYNSVQVLPEYVQQLEQMAEQYDVTQLNNYIANDPAHYDISFFAKNKHKVHAVYDEKGNLLETKGKYYNIDLPDVVVYNITSKFNDWDIKKNVCLVTYDLNSNRDITYKITLNKNNKSQVVYTDALGRLLE